MTFPYGPSLNIKYCLWISLWRRFKKIELLLFLVLFNVRMLSKAPPVVTRGTFAIYLLLWFCNFAPSSGVEHGKMLRREPVTPQSEKLPDPRSWWPLIYVCSDGLTLTLQRHYGNSSRDKPHVRCYWFILRCYWFIYFQLHFNS